MKIRNKTRMRALTCVLTALSFQALAQQKPIEYATDSRIRYVAYQENNVVEFHAKKLIDTQVLFGKDERVIKVQGGDADAWVVKHHNSLPNMIFIKPNHLNTNSNVTVLTNKHTYYLHVISSRYLEESAQKPVYAIKFIYPEEEAVGLKAKALAAQKKQHVAINPVKNPEAYNWDYWFSGSTHLTPVHVFDDGTFTYFELAHNQAVPAIFAVDDKQGKESVVNTRREGNYIVVQRIAPQFTLRSGSTVTSVFNSREIARIKQGRRPV
jgi:type IV secretion system protein VirB9